MVAALRPSQIRLPLKLGVIGDLGILELLKGPKDSAKRSPIMGKLTSVTQLHAILNPHAVGGPHLVLWRGARRCPCWTATPLPCWGLGGFPTGANGLSGKG